MAASESTGTDRNTIAAQLADLFHQTAEAHHVAYRETDGADPDWPIWYAGHLIDNGLESILEATLLKSDLIYLLVLANKQQMLEAPGAHWERYCADFFITRYLK